MATTGNGSDWLPKRVLSDLTGDTWQLSPWNLTVLKARAMITPRTNQWHFSLNEQDNSKIKTKCTNVKLVLISKLWAKSSVALLFCLIYSACLSIDRSLRVEIFKSLEDFSQLDWITSWLGQLIHSWLNWQEYRIWVQQHPPWIQAIYTPRQMDSNKYVAHRRMKLKCFERCQWQKEECSFAKGHNQPPSDSSNNVLLEGESGRPTTGPMHKAFIKTTTIAVAFTWGAFTGIIYW